MKILRIILVTVLFSVISVISFAETVSIDDLAMTNGVYYKKFTMVPFTGEVSGIENGKIEKGKQVGRWVEYYPSGQLRSIGNYKDGKRDGYWENYYYGRLWYKGGFKDGKMDGFFEWYCPFLNAYIDSGPCSITNYKDGKEDGLSKHFYPDGSLEKTETWKNGVRVE